MILTIWAVVLFPFFGQLVFKGHSACNGFFVSAEFTTAESARHSHPHDHIFLLRHVFHHGTHKFPNLHVKRDIEVNENSYSDLVARSDTHVPSLYRARSRPVWISRLENGPAYRPRGLMHPNRSTRSPTGLPDLGWKREQIQGPDITNRDTILSLARISSNSYRDKDLSSSWDHLTEPFDVALPFGWSEEGVRGYIFSDAANSTIIIGIKGTTSVSSKFGSAISVNDKINDNLLFSCCCGHGQFIWKRACDCKTSAFTCNSRCVSSALGQKDRYYHATLEIYNEVLSLYPDAQIWITGHSMGAALASLLALTVGVPAVTFGSPGDSLAASRLGLSLPPGFQAGTSNWRNGFSSPASASSLTTLPATETQIYHFGNTADPVFTGTCNSPTSSCTISGYAMETSCHTGHSCVYDTVADFGWQSSILAHRIQTFIDSVILEYDKPPKCKPNRDCVDCQLWKFTDLKKRRNSGAFSINDVKFSALSASERSTQGRTVLDGAIQGYNITLVRSSSLISPTGIIVVPQ